MKNEPVAWTACLDCGQRVTSDSIHTCSPQLKTLTDKPHPKCDEACMYLCKMREITDEEIMELSYLTSDNDPIVFARAILRKAQEKC